MKIYITIGLFILFHCTSFGQIQRNVVKQKSDSATTNPVPAKENESRKEILKELDLTKEQKVKLKEVNQSMKASKEAIENNMELSDIQKKEKLKALKKEQMSKIQSILTEEQKIKFRQLKEKNGSN